MQLSTPDRMATSYQDVYAFIEKVDLLFNEKCAVCLGPVPLGEDKQVSICGHAFHHDCLALWHAACCIKKRDYVCPDSCGASIQIVNESDE